jgi:pyruvate dehydrogenase complex dehydrogenase (E1) component
LAAATRVRRFAAFEVNAAHIAVAALSALVAEGSVRSGDRREAVARYGIEHGHEAPWLRPAQAPVRNRPARGER